MTIDQFNTDRSWISFTNAFVQLTELAAIATSWSSQLMRHLHKPSSMLSRYDVINMNL